ncbi:hypothetical protein BC332_07789 [Capsicum chinense]|nr:hypothetical protein BC332_07789 [Capsicum chinense]
MTAGAVEHNDGRVINMLLQELGGLYVRRQKDGQWFAVEPIPGALVCIDFEEFITSTGIAFSPEFFTFHVAEIFSF